MWGVLLRKGRGEEKPKRDSWFATARGTENRNTFQKIRLVGVVGVERSWRREEQRKARTQSQRALGVHVKSVFLNVTF